MHTESEPATWSAIASWYDDLLQAGSGPHELAVETVLRLSPIAYRLSPTAHGAVVLDIACGQGIASRALARAGARSVTGADLAPETIAAARRHEADEPLGIQYLVEDATTLRPLPTAAFDLVTCQLGLMDIPDLTATLTAVHRVLRPAGSFVFVIGHPCFLAPDAQTVTTTNGLPGRLITDYLHERFSGHHETRTESAEPGTITAPCRPISTPWRPAASPSNSSRNHPQASCWHNSNPSTPRSPSSSLREPAKKKTTDR